MRDLYNKFRKWEITQVKCADIHCYYIFVVVFVVVVFVVVFFIVVVSVLVVFVVAPIQHFRNMVFFKKNFKL